MTNKSPTVPTALVTGGARRIGKAVCHSLAADGYAVALHYHHSNREARETAKAIRKKGGVCELFDCDLADEEQTTNLITDVLKRFSRLDVLVNNASIFEPSLIKNFDTKSSDRHFAVNFKAPFILTAQFAQKCKKGNIINILDTRIIKNRTQHAAYLLSKKALAELTKLAAVECAPRIRVNGIAPGLILPPADTEPEYLKRLAGRVPLQKIGHVDHITRSVEFLLSNSYLTGQIIFVDGGEHLL
jgi:NAD(P)-dependent dehydrogenase (short-subunit alcohol dehydrogenase family)